MARRRIGEFTPLGFLIGFALCLGLFWFVFVRLPFGTVPPASVPCEFSRGELDRLSGEVEKNRKHIDEVESKVKSLESAQKSTTSSPRKNSGK